MSDLLATLKPYLDQYGYWAMFTAIMLEGFAVPMPGETLLIVTSFLASRGEMNFHFVLFTAWAGAVSGSNVGYAIGRYGGRILVLRYGQHVFINRSRLESVEAFFRRYGKLLIVGARFLDGLRQLNGIVAGMARMPWRQFFFYTSLGAALWVGFWGILAYQLGERVGEAGNIIAKIELWLLGGLIIAMVALGIYMLVRRHRPRRKNSKEVTAARKKSNQSR